MVANEMGINMRIGRFLVVPILLFVLVAYQQVEPTNESQKAAQVKKVSFTLYHNRKPFAGEEIAIFPFEGGAIRLREGHIGLGKTDTNGHATIEFNPAKYSEYVLMGYKEGVYGILRREGTARFLRFQCDGSRCDLGDVVFEFGLSK
ncbi:MAG: hypothetical protein HYZ50_27245 [Deltaproteobacteria bacterium]|nr:hypothetical protein [Deltaproteobacteria bacterium]